MKKLALIIFLIPALAFGQDAMELKAIRYLNEYRASKGLAPVVLDKGLSKAAQNQLSYEVLIDSVSHFQYQDLPNFEEIVRPEDRIKHFSGLSAPFGKSEITLGGQPRSSKNFDLLHPDLSKDIIEYFKMRGEGALLRSCVKKLAIRWPVISRIITRVLRFGR